MCYFFVQEIIKCTVTHKLPFYYFSSDFCLQGIYIIKSQEIVHSVDLKAADGREELSDFLLQNVSSFFNKVLLQLCRLVFNQPNVQFLEILLCIYLVGKNLKKNNKRVIYV
jgi:hypothetical protein